MENNSTKTFSNSKKGTSKTGKVFENNFKTAMELNLPIFNYANDVIDNDGRYKIVKVQVGLTHNNPDFIHFANPKLSREIDTDQLKNILKISFDDLHYEIGLEKEKNGIMIKISGGNLKQKVSLYSNKTKIIDDFLWYLEKKVVGKKEVYSINIYTKSKKFSVKI